MADQTEKPSQASKPAEQPAEVASAPDEQKAAAAKPEAATPGAGESAQAEPTDEGAKAPEKLAPKAPPASIEVTMGTPMLVEPAGVGDRYKLTLVGMIRGRALLLLLPRVQGISDHLYVEKKVTVRYMYQGNVYGFVSEIFWAQSAPFRMIYLKYPRKVETINLRQCERVDCYLPVRLHVPSDAKAIKSMMLNLSCNGCQVVVESAGEQAAALEVDAEFTLDFELFGSQERTRVKGVIKSVEQGKTRLYLGLMFKEVPDEVRRSIDNYLATMAEQPPG